MAATRGSEMLETSTPPADVLWVVTMARDKTQWDMGEDSDWTTARRMYAEHQDYGMVRDSKVRKCFQYPSSGEFNTHIHTMTRGENVSFEMNGWTIALRKVARPAASLSPPLMPNMACHPPAPRCDACDKWGQPEVGAQVWVQNSVFMCAMCSPSKLASYVTNPATVIRAKISAATKTYDEAYEALMIEGRVKEDFTAKMAGLANDFVKAAVAKEKVSAELSQCLGKKRQRT